MTNINSWGVKYSTINFFENALRGHDNVASFQRENDIFFRIERKQPLDPVNALLIDEYTLSLAAVLKARQEFSEADCIVTGGNWNAYTQEAKAYGNQNQIGIFVIAEFLGALNLTEPYQYVMRDDRKRPVYHYRNS